MSHLLWKHYHNEDVDKFRHLLTQGGQNTPFSSKSYGGLANTQSLGSLTGSPGGFATSPRTLTKNRKACGQHGNASSTKGVCGGLGKVEVNCRDHAGLTILHRAASSSSENARSFALALLEHPAIDLYAQDTENGWTALHRALYFGNITIARAIIEKDCQDLKSQVGNVIQRGASSVIKVKDYEGNSPFDVYNATIARRSLTYGNEHDLSDDDSDDAESTLAGSTMEVSPPTLDGDEVFAWGSSRNHGLGFKDQDDRQHPEKIILHRPDHLLFRFYREYVESCEFKQESLNKPSSLPKSVSDLPTLIVNRPIIIQDMALSKLHSAILTTDPESNLYICGFGPGGRLGTGDETTRFSYVPIEGGALAGKKVCKIALGQNHSLAVTSDGSLVGWGTNTHGQLGYTLSRPALKDEEPVWSSPRQIFGALKREAIVGIAASEKHSVAHTKTSLFTWGRNEGQLGLIHSDSRSLEVQPTPRKVAASLFQAAINMVSAINSATIVLLANHTVCVFTNYGYNIVKFPLHEGFTNYHLKTNAITTRYESGSNHISYVTAGGDTIGAVSSRGDLFTVTVRSIATNSATSTTNPTKIKDSLSQPERVWSLRKGHWDGIKSVGITENDSVIVCTQAGAVWRRIKRASIKDAFTGAAGKSHKKDYKFQRIPGLTNAVSVRSNMFGVYAVIRKDNDVTRTQVVVTEQSLWHDIAPMLSVRGLKASEVPQDEEDTETPRFWAPALPKDLFEPLKGAILTSPDLEADVARHLADHRLSDSYDIGIGTSSSDVRVPVHGFMMSRSPVFRRLMADFRRTGIASIPDVLTVQHSPHSTGSLSVGASNWKTEVLFQGLDFITLINLAVYLYTDSVVDVWHFTRHSPKMAFRYRQVRVELMKVAIQLQLTKLESAVRLMSEPDRRMDTDMRLALQDSGFFDDGDIIVELDGSERIVHSALMCRRCPFFEGLFNGRAGGQWLAGRRQNNSDLVRIDLKHVEAETFDVVLRYIYSDAGTEIFDDVVSDDIDEFSELVLDVLAVSDELMLDRLSQVCQQVLGRFVNARNVGILLNAIGPCAVTAFKDAALEYICLQLESMLENHLLNELDEDLLLDLNEVVRANQLNCLPFAKSGRAELLLHERHPSLAEDIREERQTRLKDMIFRMSHKDEDSRLSSSYRARLGSLDDFNSGSPSQDKQRRKSKTSRNAPFSPSIRPKDSTIDLMFDMDDDETLVIGSPSQKSTLERTPKDGIESTIRRISCDVVDHKSPTNDEPGPHTSSSSFVGSQTPENNSSGNKTWSSPALPSSRLDMREIMAQASSSRTSALSQSISAQKAQDDAIGKQTRARTSQKERKKQQQSMQQHMSQTQMPPDKGAGKPASPWQVAGLGQKTSLKDVLSESKPPSPAPATRSMASPDSEALSPRRTASPDTRFAGQSRSKSNSSVKRGESTAGSSSRPTSVSNPAKSTLVVPHSRSYMSPPGKAEPSLQLSLSDIIGQQRREQEVIKEAVAKRSLQEIQEEQAFQEWWDQESRRAQQEEAARAQNATARGGPDGGGGGAGWRAQGGRGRGGRGRGRGRGRGDAAQGGGGRGRGRGQDKAAEGG
ncbi:uncharacterized protein L3040_001529 [Drepanopeziza brunnea f. sp. 'multigermtubi']|uniref:uncharacterized protein n=1 Tax=Drepanopeziza brunnea f. sp. 'multigermtubi' TaxID=698441 RepID=UPI0023A159E9|nr:hypothetical protein L3040_001529 [Drepanopeziza brunnea f. sp. 'multigermtubi']